jgi:pyruvate dehydrogenase E2 component (dihydrolipoamide acetyltransferase)
MPSTFRRLKTLSTWRRISLHAWKGPGDPTVYGMLEINVERALPYLQRVRSEQGAHATMTHLVAKALALAIRSHPKANGMIARRRIYLRDTVDIFVQVASEGGEELSGAKVERADEKAVAEIAREVTDRAAKIRAGRDRDIERTKQVVTMLPGFLLGKFLRLIEFLTYDLGLDLSRFGVVRDGFGSAMVSNVGMFGLAFGLAPLVPLSRVPIVVLVGEVQQRPWVEGDRVVVRPVVVLGCTFDHRLIDGVQGARMAALLRSIVEDPEGHLEAAWGSEIDRDRPATSAILESART